MPFLDVSDILDDPDFATAFHVVRVTETVGDNGRPVRTEALIPAYGVITQGSGDVLERRSDFRAISGNITVHTKFELLVSDTTRNRDADLIQWNGRRYTVAAISDWSDYGTGFFAATCENLGPVP